MFEGLVNGFQAKCICQVNGEVDCRVENNVDDLLFEIRCTNCSSLKMIKDKFKQRGKHS